MTYKDVWWQLNSDRRTYFVLTDKEITPQVVQFLRRHLPTPLVSAAFAPPEKVLLRLPVKHNHALGGVERETDDKPRK